VNPLAQKLLSVVALLAGVLLIFFEWRRAGGVTADNAFWLLIGSLIVVLATLNVFQKPGKPARFEDDDTLPLG
jgi:hypothetical protein